MANARIILERKSKEDGTEFQLVKWEREGLYVVYRDIRTKEVHRIPVIFETHDENEAREFFAQL